MLSSQSGRNDEGDIKNDVELEYLKRRVVDIQEQHDDDDDVIPTTPGNVNSLQQLDDIPDEYLNITQV